MSSDAVEAGPLAANISPWLSVADAAGAVDFYKAAFGAVELERLEDDAGTLQVAQLAIGGRSPVRMILTVAEPDPVFARAVRAGATEIFPVGEGNGWRVGRLADPSGHHWEIGRPLTP